MEIAMKEQGSERELFEMLESIKQVLGEIHEGVKKINESLERIIENVSETRENMLRSIEAMGCLAQLRQEKWNMGERPDFFDMD